MWFEPRRFLVAIGFALASIAWMTVEPSPLSWGSPTEAPPAIVWEHPVIELSIFRDFYSPNGDYSAGHRGVDFESFDGEEVVSPSAGIVRFSGSVAGRSLLSIDFEGGVVAEVEPVCPTVVEGEAVLAGQIVGVVCSGLNSHCEVVCLHLSARRFSSEYSRGFIYLTPLIFLGDYAPSRLVAVGVLS